MKAKLSKGEYVLPRFEGHIGIQFGKSSGVLPSSLIQVYEIGTYRPLVSVTEIRLTADFEDNVCLMAELTMLTNEHGRPLDIGEPVSRDPETGDVRIGKFLWAVSEVSSR